MKKQNGITLIALVITIIVLLILAGVSISMVAGDNGIVSKAQLAKTETDRANAEEEQDLNDALSYINSNIPNDTDEPDNSSEDDVTLIKFTLDDVEYTAEDGMTLEDWFGSKYDPKGGLTGWGITLQGSGEYIKLYNSSGEQLCFENAGERSPTFLFYYNRYPIGDGQILYWILEESPDDEAADA